MLLQIERIKNDKLFFSILIACLTFLLFFTLFKPVHNSPDEFFYLYSLAGGHGSRPTNLLHQNYTLHPFLTWPIVQLFKLTPQFNWYTLFLIIIHLLSCINLAYTFRLMYRTTLAIIVFLLFFIFVETTLLLSFHYSNASAIAALSGLSFTLHYFTGPPRNWRKHKSGLITSVALMLIAGLLRVHMIGLCIMLVTWIAFFQLPFQRFRTFSIAMSSLVVIVLLFNLCHKLYYEKEIPDWSRLEYLRQLYFQTFNKHRIISDVQIDSVSSLKVRLIKSVFLYDTSFISLRNVETVLKNKATIRTLGERANFLGLKWMFINNRVYLALVGSILFLAICKREFKLLKKWIVMSLISLLLFIFLLLFMNAPDHIRTILFSIVLLSAIFCFRDLKLNTDKFVIITSGLLLFSCIWMMKLHLQKSEANHRNNMVTKSLLEEINTYSSHLYIDMDNSRPYRYFDIWDTPTDYPAKNFIYNELKFTGLDKTIFQRFDIHDITQDIVTNDKVFIIGSGAEILKDYYRYAKGWNVEVDRIPQAKYPKVYKIKIANETPLK